MSLFIEPFKGNPNPILLELNGDYMIFRCIRFQKDQEPMLYLEETRISRTDPLPIDMAADNTTDRAEKLIKEWKEEPNAK